MTKKNTLTPPRSLSAKAKAVWRKFVEDIDTDVVSESDWRAIERYAINYVQWQKCCEFIERNGSCYFGTNGMWSPFPQAKERDQLHKFLRECENDFGLSPRGRMAVTRKNKPKKSESQSEQDNASRFLGVVG